MQVAPDLHECHPVPTNLLLSWMLCLFPIGEMHESRDCFVAIRGTWLGMDSPGQVVTGGGYIVNTPAHMDCHPFGDLP